MGKPCGHAAHPEDGNFDIVPTGSPATSHRAEDVKNHLTTPKWFVGKFCKLGFPVPNSTHREYMWVEAQAIEKDKLQGPLKNTPLKIPALFHGDLIEFAADEIIDVYEET